MFAMPWSFIWIGVVLILPEVLWKVFVTRPKQKYIEHQQRKTALFWRIRDLEQNIYGEWRS